MTNECFAPDRPDGQIVVAEIVFITDKEEDEREVERLCLMMRFGNQEKNKRKGLLTTFSLTDGDSSFIMARDYNIMEKTMLSKTVGIVYNACYGGFSLSHEAVLKYLEYKGIPVYPMKTDYGFYTYYLAPWEGKKDAEMENLPSFYDRNVSRHDQVLVRVVREMGEKANGGHAKLAIKEVDKGTFYRIDEYDGYESVVCQHDVVWSIAE